MTTPAQVYAAMQEARDVAAQVFEAVRGKYIATTNFVFRQEAEGMFNNAAQNLATVELLPEILEEALAARPDDQAEAFAQAMVVVEMTQEATERYAAWVDRNNLVHLVKLTWGALVELVADLAYEVANAILVVGRKAAEGLGWLAWLGGGLLLVAGVAYARR